MSRLYCPNCGEETAEYQQDATVQFVEAKTDTAIVHRQEGEMHVCISCGTGFVLVDVKKE